MPRRATLSSGDDEPLEDKTAAIPLHSKRSERQRRKQTKRDRKRDATVRLTQLPTELLLACLKASLPGDVLSFGRVNQRFRALVHANARVIGDSITAQRYPILAQCFPLPKLLADVPPAVQAAMAGASWQGKLDIHKKYHHVPRPPERVVCSCVTCTMAWNNLAVAVDFAHWQRSLDTGMPLPMVPRGQSPEWNQALLRRNASVVTAALRSSLWHARILEMHLDSTVRSIKRQAKNTGNKRKHVDMTPADEDLGTDAFLEKPGPPSVEFVFHRDNYYMLEAYLPNRFWKEQDDGEQWIYVFGGQHKRDIEVVERLAERLLHPGEQSQSATSPTVRASV